MSAPLNILTGMILGDASVITPSGCRNAMLKLQHGPAQAEYLLHKVAILEEITSVNVRHIIDDGYGHETWIAETKTHPLYTRLRRRWYANGLKQVTYKALDPLDAEGLAYWYMDDGSLTVQHKTGTRVPKSRRFRFHTEGFTKDENDLLRGFVEDRFGIRLYVAPHKRSNKSYWALGCGAIVGKQLLEIIRPYVLPMFEHKLNMRYASDKR